ncbi:MAG: MATE family efflux transporter [Pseudomonadota bacterium]
MDNNLMLSASIRRDIRRTLALAGPMMIAHGTPMMVSTIDTIMVGRAATDELAYLSIGRALLWIVAVVCFGLISGITVFIARADVAERQSECGQFWRQGLIYAAGLGVVAGAGLALISDPLFHALGLAPALADEGADYVKAVAIGFPFMMALGASFGFLEGVSKPWPGMIIMLSTLPLNIGFNVLLIYGAGPIPAMGATGAGIGTALSQLSGAIIILVYLNVAKGLERYGVQGIPIRRWLDNWSKGAAMRRFGIAPGLATGLEFLGFTSLTYYSGLMGVVQTSAFNVVVSLHFFSLIVCIGMATASSIRVGNAVGRKDAAGVERAALVATTLGVISITPFAAIYLIDPGLAVGIYTEDAEVLRLASQLMLILAPFIFFDALQFIILFSLRAAGDEVMASILQIMSMCGGMLVGGWILAFPLGLGSVGLVWSLIVAIVVAALLLGSRFFVVQRRLERTQVFPDIY